MKARNNWKEKIKSRLRSTLSNLIRIKRNFYCLILSLGYDLNFFSQYEIPVVINNFNRLTYLTQLIGFLESCGFKKIIIIDNNSTYQPLLEFYKECKHPVIRFSINYGHLAFWKSGLYLKYKWNYFLYTDSDVSPIVECPKNFIEYLKANLDLDPKLDKLGLGIKIDDLPDYFALKAKIVAYEEKYWQNEVRPNIYDAKIDTTLALYKPLSDLKFGEISTLSACRCGYPYLIRHLPWYVDSQNLAEEEKYYLLTSNSSSSLGKQFRGDGKVY